MIDDPAKVQVSDATEFRHTFRFEPATADAFTLLPKRPDVETDHHPEANSTRR